MSRAYGKTSVSIVGRWGLMCARGSKLLCSDGKVRAPSRLAHSPDTFFSTPCAMKVKGKYVTGYMTVAEAFVPPVYNVTRLAYVFRQHTGEKNSDVLPPWPTDWFTQEAFDLLADGETVVDGK